MNKLNLLVILGLGLALVGCSGGNEEVKETKASDVKVDMTEQQKADIAAKFKDPGFAAKMKN
jgi:hypothetical protein